MPGTGEATTGSQAQPGSNATARAIGSRASGTVSTVARASIARPGLRRWTAMVAGLCYGCGAL